MDNKNINKELMIIEEKINSISLVIYEFNINLQTEIDSIVSELCYLKETIENDDKT